MDPLEMELINFILEECRKEIPYEERLDQQKTLLLAQKKLEHWKRMSYEIERIREQYRREDRIEMKQLFKERNFSYSFNEQELKMMIDHELGPWLHNDEIAEEKKIQQEINGLRARIGRKKQQVSRCKLVFEQIQNSKSHQLMQKSSRKIREEEAKVEKSRKKVDDLWKESCAHAKIEWNETKLMIIELSELYTGCHKIDSEKEVTLQNNEIKAATIVQLRAEIEQTKIQQEEEAKRREIELSERMLIPIKIAPMTLEPRIFKNPNDFPALVEKLKSTRKSYEEIFKRPEYVDYQQYKKKHKKNRFSNLEKLYIKSKRKGKSRKNESSVTAKTTVKPVTTDEVATNSKNDKDIVAKSSASAGHHISECSVQPDRELSKSQPLPVTDENRPTKEPPVTNKRKSSDELTEDQHRPSCNAKEQSIKKQTAQTMSQPVRPVVNRDNAKSEPPAKRPSLEPPTSASGLSSVQDHGEFKKPYLIHEHSSQKPKRMPKPKKVTFNPERECGSFSFSPEKSNMSKPMQTSFEQGQVDSFNSTPQQRNRKSNMNLMDFEPHPQTVEDDNFSFGSASPPLESVRSKDDGECFLDTDSTSSFDMEDRESGSDLELDLSPIGSRKNNKRSSKPGEEENGSDGNSSDFDFLASPPNSAARVGSQGGDCFAFTDEDDSGSGFDFF